MVNAIARAPNKKGVLCRTQATTNSPAEMAITDCCSFENFIDQNNE